MKKILAVVLAAVLLACMPGVALAGDAQADMSGDAIITPMYVVINNADCNISISANGTANMYASISCASNVTKIRMVQNLQRYNGGWQTIDSWSQYYYSNSASWSDSLSVTSGSYRLYVYFYAYSGSTLLESTSRYSTDTY